MVKPIRKSLLIHSIAVEPWEDDDRFGGSYGAPVTVDYVRVEPKNSYIVDANGGQNVSNTLLFIDAVHTKPKLDITEQSKVLFDGDEYMVAKVNVHYADKPTPHHWEVYLV